MTQQFSDQKKESETVDEPEQTLWSGNYSSKAMFGAWVMAAVVSVFVPVALMMVATGDQNVWLVAIVVIVGLWVWLTGLALYRKFSYQYWVTTQRLKHRSGILFRESNRLEMIDIDDVSYIQGPIQAMLGVGDIRIRSSDSSHPELDLLGIANVQQVADLIDDARRQERRKRGLHIEAI